MRVHSKPKTLKPLVRRSFALPGTLIEEVLSVVSHEERGNLNRLVTEALQEFVARRRADVFEKEMAAMAADPAIQAEMMSISTEFAVTDADGLGYD